MADFPLHALAGILFCLLAAVCVNHELRLKAMEGTDAPVRPGGRVEVPEDA
jgi:hypothetical protein